MTSLATFEKIRDRFQSPVKAPARKDISADFPLRGIRAVQRLRQAADGLLVEPETTMTDGRMALLELVEKGADGDLVREMLAFAAQRLLELEVEAAAGAPKGARSAAPGFAIDGERMATRRLTPALGPRRPVCS